MGCESFDVVRFDLGPLLQGQMRVAKFKSAFNLLIIEKWWPFPVDTSCIWPQMCPWSSFYKLLNYFWVSHKIVKLQTCSSLHS